ncbi:MAG: flavodoxin family protein [Spirochaetia bacterium]
MKIVGVIASPHVDGSGAVLVREALRSARTAGASVSEVFLSEYRIEYCRDCNTCSKSGRCSVQDDFDNVRTQLVEADGIILSSPVYGRSLSARMKNLFDRLKFTLFTSSLGSKYVIGIATATRFGAKKVARLLAAGVQRGIFHRSYVVGTLAVHLGGRHVSFQPRALRAAAALGRKMVNDFKVGKKYPFQNLFGRLLNALVSRPLTKKLIEKNKNSMGGVYDALVKRGDFPGPLSPMPAP